VAEKLFRIVSLGFLTVGFIVCVAGADKNGPKDLANATDELIQHVSAANEANQLAHPVKPVKPLTAGGSIESTDDEFERDVITGDAFHDNVELKRNAYPKRTSK